MWNLESTIDYIQLKNHSVFFLLCRLSMTSYFLWSKTVCFKSWNGLWCWSTPKTYSSRLLIFCLAHFALGRAQIFRVECYCSSFLVIGSSLMGFRVLFPPEPLFSIPGFYLVSKWILKSRALSLVSLVALSVVLGDTWPSASQRAPACTQDVENGFFFLGQPFVAVPRYSPVHALIFLWLALTVLHLVPR